MFFESIVESINNILDRRKTPKFQDADYFIRFCDIDYDRLCYWNALPGLVNTVEKIKLKLFRLPPGSKNLSHPTFVSPSPSSPTEGILTRLKKAFSASLYLRPPLYQYRRRRLWRMSASSSSLNVSGLAEKRTLDVRLVPSFILLSMAGTVSFWITCVSESQFSQSGLLTANIWKIQYTLLAQCYLPLWERYVIKHLLEDSFTLQ